MVISKKITVLIAAIILLAVGLFNMIGRTYAFNVINTNDTSLSINLKKLINKEAVDSDDSWKDIVDKEIPVFSYDKWEPGAMRASVLKVENPSASTYSFKHKLYLYATEGSTSVNLADVMSVYLYKGLYEPTSSNERPDLADGNWISLGRMGSTKDAIPENAVEISLNPGESQVYTLVMKMDESAGNAYQGAEANVYAVVYAEQTTN